MAGGVADRKEDRQIFPAGFFKCFGAPGEPVHRIMGVLEQIWTLFVCEAIGVHGCIERRRRNTTGAKATTSVLHGIKCPGWRHERSGTLARCRLLARVVDGPKYTF